jgi:acetyl esterase/lipase
MPVQDWSHADFPESTATADGILEIDAGPVGSRQVSVELGLTYAVKDGRPLHLVVIRPGLDRATADDTPSNEGERLPLLVFVQGSAWREQQLGVALVPLIEFARRGYVIAVVEYRPSSVAEFPAQVADTLTATRWLLDRARDFEIDPRRVALWGDSSGGHTTLLAAVAGHDPFFTDEPDQPPVPFRCFVDFYGPTDLGRMDDEPTTMAHNAAGSPESDLLGGGGLSAIPERVRRTDPRTYLTAERRLPPIFIAHGTKDRLVPFAQSVLVYEALRAADQPVELVKVRGAAHGGPSFWTDELMDLVAGFLARHLGPG